MSRCRFGLFEFDLLTGELRREGEIVKLPPQPTRVLTLLLERPGDLVLREQLRDRIWGHDTFVDFERGLNFCILQVRAALGDVPENPRFVQTVPRKGYRFIAPVETSSRTVPAGSPETAAPPIEAATTTQAAAVARRHVSAWMTAVGALVLLAVVAVVVLGWRRIGAPDPVTLPDRIRVAVLPFVNLTGDATLDYFGDALTDDVISQLGQMGRAHVSVIARTSAMSYRKSSKTVAQIGEELGVRFVVESSVRRHGDHLRIATNLIRVSDGTAASSWNETFDAPSPGGQLQHTRATVRLARLIALELAPGVVPDHADASSVDAAAWNTFVTAKALANSGTASGARQALVLFETAAKQAPDFAAAWAKAAETRHLLVMMGGVAPGAMYPAAQVAANRAVQVDLNLADAHLALGLVQLWYEWRPGLAAKTFERALSLNPSLAAAHHDYAWSLVALGRNEDAVRHITTARALDPLSARANNDVGWLYLHLGDASEAMRACEHTLAIQPESLEAQACLERAYVLRDQPEAALAAAKATTPALSGSASSTASHAREALRSIWRWRLRQGEQAAQTRWMNPYTTAGLLAALGENDRAVASLEDAYDDRVGMMLHLARDPAFAALRGDPRLQALIRRVDQQRDR